MIFGFNIRVVAYLRRLTRAAESISKSLETIARCAEDEWAAKHAPRIATKVQFGTLDIAEVNKRYRLEREALGLAEDES